MSTGYLEYCLSTKVLDDFCGLGGSGETPREDPEKVMAAPEYPGTSTSASTVCERNQ